DYYCSSFAVNITLLF
nr:immunoglobulin light chain junction region [Macaca mulatta]MOX20520.1 immunoglobulin light chain junction region [Macaca mulatta]MOX21244.1 immunoglobulin light chain junction region [Macaca mulatta]MOX22419.1 immunoglobulin light chain junction region [Macaca mulatta]